MLTRISGRSKGLLTGDNVIERANGGGYVSNCEANGGEGGGR